MRSPVDIDAKLKALKDRAKALKAKKTAQLGDLVTMAGASGLDPEILAGALLSISGQARPTLRYWRAGAGKAVSFFRDVAGPARLSAFQAAQADDFATVGRP